MHLCVCMQICVVCILGISCTSNPCMLGFFAGLVNVVFNFKYILFLRGDGKRRNLDASEVAKTVRDDLVTRQFLATADFSPDSCLHAG